MVTTATKVLAFREITKGELLSKVANDFEVSTTTINSWMLSLFKRALKLPTGYEGIRSNPAPYQEYVEKLEKSPTFYLTKNLSHKLSAIIPKNDITPKYLSNLSASLLISKGLSTLNITELQEWLVKSGFSLKPELPKKEDELKRVREAVAILEVYHFDAVSVRSQLDNLLSEDDS